MKIKNGAEYIESLRKIKPVIYYKGEKIEDVTRHPSLRVAVEHIAQDYVFANHLDFKDLLTQTDEDGELVSFYFSQPRKAEDLLRRRQIIQTLSSSKATMPT